MVTIPNSEHPQEDTHQRIMEAALQLFAEMGYAQTPTRLIAERAGVNEVTLFRHFGSKKALLMACVEAKNTAGFAATFESELSGDYPADIRMMTQRQIADMSANIEILQMLLCDARSLPELRPVLVSGIRSNQARLVRYFQRQIEAGVVRPDLQAESMAIAFDSLFSSSILFETVFQSELSTGQRKDELILQLADLFVRGTMK